MGTHLGATRRGLHRGDKRPVYEYLCEVIIASERGSLVEEDVVGLTPLVPADCGGIRENVGERSSGEHIR
jgi:hypothetical protein